VGEFVIVGVREIVGVTVGETVGVGVGVGVELADTGGETFSHSSQLVNKVIVLVTIPFGDIDVAPSKTKQPLSPLIVIEYVNPVIKSTPMNVFDGSI
jgi:hypothetical protein